MGGKPPHVPSDDYRRQVEAFAAFGLTAVQMSLLLKITPKTLRKHYRDELDAGYLKANAKVAQSLFKMATSGENTSATIFWLKARAGWSENDRRFWLDVIEQLKSMVPGNEENEPDPSAP